MSIKTGFNSFYIVICTYLPTQQSKPKATMKNRHFRTNLPQLIKFRSNRDLYLIHFTYRFIDLQKINKILIYVQKEKKKHNN